MKNIRRLSLISFLLICGVFAQEPKAGLKPRKAPADYPVHASAAQFIIGAAQLSSTEVEHAFVTELNKGYVVVEVGVYPESASTLNLDRRDFVLRVAGTKTLLRAARPETIAAIMQKRPTSDRDIELYPTAGIGYETGRDPYGRSGGGVVTSVGTGVGIGRRQSNGTSEADRKTMETELKDKSLPLENVAKPVAGYLYFPLPSNKTAAYELEYMANGETVKLALPVPR